MKLFFVFYLLLIELFFIFNLFCFLHIYSWYLPMVGLSILSTQSVSQVEEELAQVEEDN